MRFAVLVFVAIMLLSIGLGVSLDRQDILPAGQDAAPFSFHLLYPYANDRMSLDFITKTLLDRIVSANDPLYWPTSSRIPPFLILGFYTAGVLAILVVWRNLLNIKFWHFPIRLFSMPLGSHATPNKPAMYVTVFFRLQCEF